MRPPFTINTTGVSAAGVKFLLDYVYTSKLALSLANVQDVLSAASHLQVLISRNLGSILPHSKHNSHYNVLSRRC